jgi:hypothetical protein
VAGAYTMGTSYIAASAASGAVAISESQKYRQQALSSYNPREESSQQVEEERYTPEVALSQLSAQTPDELTVHDVFQEQITAYTNFLLENPPLVDGFEMSAAEIHTYRDTVREASSKTVHAVMDIIAEIPRASLLGDIPGEIWLKGSDLGQNAARVVESLGYEAENYEDFVAGLHEIVDDIFTTELGHEFSSEEKSKRWVNWSDAALFLPNPISVSKGLKIIPKPQWVKTAGKKGKEFVQKGLSKTNFASNALKNQALKVFPMKVPHNKAVKVGLKDINSYIKGGKISDKGGLYKSGRSLAKHGGRGHSFYSLPKGTPDQINAQGQKLLESILKHPSAVAYRVPHDRHGEVIKVISEKGAVMYSMDKTLINFLEP